MTLLAAYDVLKEELLRHVVLHADETPVPMLKPVNGKTHRAYLWTYAPGALEELKALVYDFCESPAGAHAKDFLGNWQGSLVCDDYFAMYGVTQAAALTPELFIRRRVNRASKNVNASVGRAAPQLGASWAHR